MISLERKLRNASTAPARDWKKDRDAIQTRIIDLKAAKERHLEEIAGLHTELQELRPSDPLLSGIDDTATDEEVARRRMREEISKLRLGVGDTRALLRGALAELKTAEARAAEL